MRGSIWKPTIYYAVNLHGIGEDQSSWFPGFTRVCTNFYIETWIVAQL
jgi:hypothetical protein